MGDKFDFKKEYNDLYMPKNKPSIINVPSMNFIMIDGKGDPSNNEYQMAVAALYALTYTIKMSKMGGRQPQGYFEYATSPFRIMVDLRRDF